MANFIIGILVGIVLIPVFFVFFLILWGFRALARTENAYEKSRDQMAGAWKEIAWFFGG